MKTDYERLGKCSLERLRSAARAAEEVQARLLGEILLENKNTEYGRRYGFGRIASVREYQDRVPVTDYEDYEGSIADIAEGKEGVLTKKPAVYFCISSGSTGEAKYVPLTEDDFTVFSVYGYGLIFGMVREYYRELPADEIFGKIFQVGEFAKTFMPDGRMNGIRSGSYYQWMDRDGAFDVTDYCAPREVLFPDKLEDLTYVKVRFALAERGIRAIHGVFVNRVAGILSYIYKNWELLLRDMEQGTVDESIGLSGTWQRFLREHLPPDPVRAGELRSLDYDGLPQGMAGKLWPELRYILAIGGERFPYYTECMKLYARDIPIHYYAYAASEGIFAVSREMNEPDSYILVPESGFFEFLPADGAKECRRPLLMTQLHTGSRYEFLYTSRSGLYRYRMGDVVEVTGWYGQAPVIKFCYRKEQVLNIAGEKYNVQQLEQAVRGFSEAAGMTVKGFCVQEETTEELPRYLVYMECAGERAEDGAGILEQCFCEANCGYAGCRRLNEIQALRLEYLPEGSFEQYEKHLAARGVPVGQYKLLRILDTEEKRKFFADAVRKG